MTIRIIQGNCLDVLKTLPENSVHCCVTSPPYWKVRSFQCEPTVWGGDPDCEHVFEMESHSAVVYSLAHLRQLGKKVMDQHGHCTKCPAVFCALGSESTPEMYINNLRLVFREVNRVLRPDGSLWLNLGDRRQDKVGQRTKPKDLIGLPWATALALRDDGWFLRSAIVLSKRAPIPERRVERPITSYDFLFMMTKSPRAYYDKYAVKQDNMAVNVKDVWVIDHEYANSLDHHGTFPQELPRRCILLGTSGKGVCRVCGAPWKRVVEETKLQTTSHNVILPKRRLTATDDWIPTCQCGANDPVGGTVLDPFGGTGTSSLVAELLHRDSISIELSPEWVKTMKKRLSRDGGLLISIQEETLCPSDHKPKLQTDSTHLNTEPLEKTTASQ